jgi:hypothetical protein
MRRFARPAEDGLESDAALCRYLQAIPRSTASGTFWCGKTMSSDGPDGAPAQPEACTDERACFEPATVEGRG